MIPSEGRFGSAKVERSRDSRCVEDDQVGGGSRGDPAAVVELQIIGGDRGHLGDRLARASTISSSRT